ncbi:MAG TPA: MaoC/PaaZ C-terminal domain-containing protein [Acidimicrobiales bacterium]|nr:MaoC/PaaZ C-terminal domain-containing protein [Acidimicrobiales bacterium]
MSDTSTTPGAGAAPAVTFGTVDVGDEAPVLTHTLTRADLVQYAGASGDFNPMHTDEPAAKEAGLASVFGHGMFSAGLLATALTNWVGVGNLVRYNVRFVKQTWPGEEFATRIKVTAKREDGGRHLVDLECSLSNQHGEVKVAGEATAALPD